MSDSKPRGVKAELHLLPLRALWPIAEVCAWAIESKGYAPRSWKNAEAGAARVYAEACARHVLAWLDGEENDPGPDGSGMSHLHHAGASLLIAIWLDLRDRGELEP